MARRARAGHWRFHPFLVGTAATAGGGGGGDYEGPLDLVSGAVVAYGHRALSAAMLGQPLYRLRRDSDDAEMTFNSDGDSGEAPIADITTWLGAANGFCKTWFDQSGNGHDMLQSDESKQFSWTAVSANGKPCFTADGTNDWVATAGNVSFANGAFTVFGVVKVISGAGNSPVLCANANQSGPDFVTELAPPNATDLRLVAFADDTGFSNGNGFGNADVVNGLNTYAVVEWSWDDATDFAAFNGAAVTVGSDFNYGDGNSGACSQRTCIGVYDAITNGNRFFKGELLEVIAFAAVLSAPNLELIEANEAGYYDIELS